MNKQGCGHRNALKIQNRCFSLCEKQQACQQSQFIGICFHCLFLTSTSLVDPDLGCVFTRNADTQQWMFWKSPEVLAARWLRNICSIEQRAFLLHNLFRIFIFYELQKRFLAIEERQMNKLTPMGSHCLLLVRPPRLIYSSLPPYPFIRDVV